MQDPRGYPECQRRTIWKTRTKTNRRRWICRAWRRWRASAAAPEREHLYTAAGPPVSACCWARLFRGPGWRCAAAGVWAMAVARLSAASGERRPTSASGERLAAAGRLGRNMGAASRGESRLRTSAAAAGSPAAAERLAAASGGILVVACPAAAAAAGREAAFPAPVTAAPHSGGGCEWGPGSCAVASARLRGCSSRHLATRAHSDCGHADCRA